MERDEMEPATSVSDREPPAPGASPPSFEAFFEAEHAGLLRALYVMTGDAQESEELTQEAFVAVWERWDHISTMERPTGYLYRVAMNRFRSRWRATVRAARLAISGVERGDAFAAADERDALARALATLPTRQRAAVVLTELLGYGAEETGRILGVKAATVRSLASQARSALRVRLEERDE